MSNVHSAGEFYSAFPERRINPYRPEIRSAEGDGGSHIVGYASVFNKLSRKLGGFVEKVAPRAFNQSGAEGWPDVVCRYNHNDDFLLGTTKAGTCRIDVDADGLLYDVMPPSFRSDIVELCLRGDVAHSSFAFRVPDGGDEWGLSDFSYPLRTLVSVELVDVAPVITPAYPDATSAARAMDGAIESLARYAQAEPAEIRSLLESNQGVKLFKRTDRPSVPAVTAPVEIETPVEEPEMSLEEKRMALYEEEVRAKYDAAALKKAASSGAAMPNDKGDPSYPIQDEEDLHNAIHAVGRGHASHEAIRQHIIARAKALGLSNMLPADWTGDSEKNSAEEEAEERTDEVTETAEEAVEETEEDRAAKAAAAKKAAAKKSDSDDDEDDEDDEDAPKSKSGKPVGKGEDQLPPWLQKKRSMEVFLSEKRYDPYFFDGE